MSDSRLRGMERAAEAGARRIDQILTALHEALLRVRSNPRGPHAWTGPDVRPGFPGLGVTEVTIARRWSFLSGRGDQEDWEAHVLDAAVKLGVDLAVNGDARQPRPGP